MAGQKLEQYTVTINGIEHTMQLDPDDAERYGDAAVKASKSAQPANKSATPTNK
jgi:hypothetical protein